MNNMNKRLREIASQVLDELVPETWVALGYDKIKEIQNRTAELIVKEMLVTCEEHPGWTGRMIGEQIKQHFGVEE
jgi:hypothetical protein